MNDRGGQLGLPGLGYENRSLFSENFLEDRLSNWDSFLDIDVDTPTDALAAIWSREGASIASANEAQTEDRLIQPILDLLGFERTVQVDSRLQSGRRIPDYALFASVDDRLTSESSEGLERFKLAVALAEAKRFGIALDKRGGGAGPQEDPEAQVLDYMWRTRVRWSILTNGKEWRLYGQAGDLVEAAHFSIPDLPALIEADDRTQLRYFFAFFSASAFRMDASGTSFLDRAFAESEANARAIGDSLRDQMFAAVPKIATGLLGEDPRDQDHLNAAFSNSLVILYRLLFCLYAESRELLPVDNAVYAQYGLRRHRDEILAASRSDSMRSDRLYNDLEILFNLVNEGDPDLGINQYNGGLFSEEGHPWLTGRAVPDPLMREALVSLYAVNGQNIDYRDLSIRHLGTMYEQLLEFRLADEDGEIVLEGAAGRHETGSYFTPEQIVDAIVDRTLDPVLTGVSEQLRASGTTGEDALEAFLTTSVCDPAMGSGHFLVAAATYISRFVATDPSQEGEDINELAIRRRVTERCLHGVDLNPMAVELARLALWLATVDPSRPLTFLDNLRAGNSLVGADMDDLRADIVYSQRLTEGVEKIIEHDSEIQDIPSDTADEIHAKEVLAAASIGLRSELEQFADETILPYFPDGLEDIFHWEIEFPEIFFDADGSPKPGSGFDAIVGNPPYVRIQELGRPLANFCRNRFESAHGSFDIYIVFIERSFGLLANGGRLGFIVPNKFMKLDYGKKLRGSLAESGVVREVIDFGDAQIFAGATNYTCILTLVKEAGDAVDYIRVPDRGRIPVAGEIDRAPVERFPIGDLSGAPWVLLPARERSILDQSRSGSIPLEEASQAIFTGLQTSADPVYIVEDRGPSANGRRVYSQQSAREFELESDLLHPRASGRDIDRWSVNPLKNLLIFPYEPSGNGMRLLSPEALGHLPRTAAYFEEHEQLLRVREGGAMDHDGWYAFGRTQSLGYHRLAKLGVAATVEHLEIAPDADGGIYFHNVRVNGILPREEGPGLWTLLAILNSRVLDFIFRRIASQHANGYFAANKQFIAPLPIRLPDSGQSETLEGLSRQLHAATNARNEEMGSFRIWLSEWIGLPLTELAGHSLLTRYDLIGSPGILEILRGNRRQITVDPDSREASERIRAEVDQSLEKLRPFRGVIEECEPQIEQAVFDLYEMSSAQRATINEDYPV